MQFVPSSLIAAGMASLSFGGKCPLGFDIRETCLYGTKLIQG
jgi:hypothetical protein